MQQVSHLIKLRRQVERRMKGAVVAGGSFKGQGKERCKARYFERSQEGGSIDSTTPFGRTSWSVRRAARVHLPAWSGGVRSDSGWWRCDGTGTREGLTDLVVELVIGAGYALSVRRLPYLVVDPAHLVLVVS